MDEPTYSGVSNRTFRDFWHCRVDANPDAEFLVYGSTTMTFGQLDEAADRVANVLSASGVGIGDLVALALPSDPRLLTIQIAVLKLGAVMVPTIYGITSAELGYVLGHSSPGVLITDQRTHDGLATGGVRRPGLTFVFAGDTAAAPGAEVRRAEELFTGPTGRPTAPDITPDSPMSIMYTSGSTGKPKGVVQPQRGIVGAGYAIADRLDATRNDTFFCCLPLFHAAATHMLFAPAVAVGARMALEQSFSKGSFWSRVRDSRATLALLFPAQLAILMTAAPSPRDRDHSLRAIFTHIQPRDFMDRFGVNVVVTWAMTETSGLGTMSKPGEHVEPKGVGRPMLAVEVKTVDADGRDTAAMEPGELLLRHPGMMLEYYRDPENTAATKRDGWLRTGDLCDVDVSGQVRFHGRLKNVIKRAGENIAGEEVEFCIMEYPGIADCVAVSVPDPIYTEEVHAIVSAIPGSGATAADVITWCQGRLADWKIPRYVTVLDRPLPRLANGKLDRTSANRNNPATAAHDFGSRTRRRAAWLATATSPLIADR